MDVGKRGLAIAVVTGPADKEAAIQTRWLNYGVQPDVFVDDGPSDFLSGHDRQVEKAIEVLQAQLK